MNIWDIAQKISYSPYLLSRIIVEGLKADRPVIEYMRNPTLINDSRLENDVRVCLEQDEDYSLHVDRMKNTIGIEYELLLQRKLTLRNIPYENESSMRLRGMAKTPDIMLLLPIAVKDHSEKWHAVTWIDSKAMFGSHFAFEDQLKQLHGYVNRFGPGMVIYWYDFLESLNSSSYKHYSKEIFVTNEFPNTDSIMFPDDPQDDVIGSGAFNALR